MYIHTCACGDLHSNWLIIHAKISSILKSWRYFPHFQLYSIQLLVFLCVRFHIRTLARTWPVADQTGDLAMNWTIDVSTINSRNIGTSMQNLFNMLGARTLIARIYAENCIFFLHFERQI